MFKLRKIFTAICIGVLCVAFLLSGCAPQNASARASAQDTASPQAETPPISNADVKPDPDKAAQAMAKSALSMYSHLAEAKGETDLVFSPASYTLALAMLSDGASGVTKEGILQTLGYTDMDWPAATAHVRGLLENLKSDDPELIIRIANALYAAKDFAVNPAYSEQMETYYDAKTGSVDFSDQADLSAIDKWVSEATNGHLSGIGAKDGAIDPNALLVLVNTLYFKANWQLPFERKETQAFNLENSQGSRQVDMMYASGEFSYYAGENYQAVSPLYNGQGRDYRMLLVRPADGVTLQSFMQNFTAEQYFELLNNMTEQQGTLACPEFSTENMLSLSDALKGMGMNDAFGSDKTDFSAIDPENELLVSDVLQNARIDVTQEGTEASAATSVIMARGISVGETFSMTLDKPFFYCVYDHQTGTPLFMGAYYGS